MLGIIEESRETIQQQDEEIGRLKGEKARPNIEPSRMEPEAGREPALAPAGEAAPVRPGSAKRRKTRELPIHREITCPPPAIPEGAKFRGHEPCVARELLLEACHTRFLVECWPTPEGKYRRGELPAWVDGHFGPKVKATLRSPYHHGRTTRPLWKAVRDRHFDGANRRSVEPRPGWISGRKKRRSCRRD